MVKFECPSCTYHMQTAQYLNGKGHCLKCNAVVADVEAHPLNPEWVKKMKVKFDRYNTDGQVNKNGYGTLDFDEMSALLRKGNPDMTDEELRLVFDGADTNGNGFVEFTEFLWFLYGHPEKGGGKASGAPPSSATGGKRPSNAGRSKHVASGTRAAGEASTHKLAPSDACESESGVCPKNDGGPHHFKFGACSHCRAPEGKLSKGAGAFANAGGDAGCPKGGKCMFKFGKCSKCHKREC